MLKVTLLSGTEFRMPTTPCDPNADISALLRKHTSAENLPIFSTCRWDTRRSHADFALASFRSDSESPTSARAEFRKLPEFKKYTFGSEGDLVLMLYHGIKRHFPAVNFHVAVSLTKDIPSHGRKPRLYLPCFNGDLGRTLFKDVVCPTMEEVSHGVLIKLK